MNNLVAQIEKMKPFFEKVSRNKYLRAIKDGFVMAIPVILFSSIFMLLAYVPNIFGFYWSETVENLLVKPYNYSMGVVGLIVAGTTAKNLTDSFNRDLPPSNKMSNISTMIAAIVGFLLLSVDQIEGGFSTAYMGTTGLISAFIAAFITVNIYYFFIKNEITISMPEEVPPNIAQTFTDLIPFSVSTLVFFAIDFIVRQTTGTNFAQAVIELFQPLFSAADGYIGLAIIFGAMSFFWFIGIHGPSIVEPAISAIMFVNLDANLELIQAGEQAVFSLTPGLQYFVATAGGTGATFVVPYMFMWLAKSKQNKAVGKASFVPTSFGVNEPILFGAPIVLNPVFFVPFMLAPIVNVWLFKFFVEVIGMDSFMYFLPWTTPAPIGIVLGTGLTFWALIFAVLILVVDVLIYYPFFKVYDKQKVEEEMAIANEDVSSDATPQVEEKIDTDNYNDEKSDTEEKVIVTEDGSDINVLVLCAGGGTSAMLANSLNKGAKEHEEPIAAHAGTYGNHREIMPEFDMVILAPQVMSFYEDIAKEAQELDIQIVKTSGVEYVNLTKDPEGALKFVKDVISK